MSDTLHQWPHSTEPTPYGDVLSYEKGMAWLEGLDIEDWGCGTAFAKRYHKAGGYRGIDGTPTYADILADLRVYRSKTDGIFMRHVLEHNHAWKDILSSAVESFQKRMVLILFTPFAKTTNVLAYDWGVVPSYSFKKTDLVAFFKSFLKKEETLKTATQYQHEHLFYLEKP